MCLSMHQTWRCSGNNAQRQLLKLTRDEVYVPSLPLTMFYDFQFVLLFQITSVLFVVFMKHQIVSFTDSPFDA